jgi:hypothetical protein
LKYPKGYAKDWIYFYRDSFGEQMAISVSIDLGNGTSYAFENISAAWYIVLRIKTNFLLTKWLYKILLKKAYGKS